MTDSADQSAEEDAQKTVFSGVYYSDDRKQLMRIDGTELTLRPQSVAVFNVLAASPDRVVSKNQLFDSVWPDTVVTDDSLAQCISEIRKALSDDDHTTLRTLHRKGYMLIADTPKDPASESVAVAEADPPAVGNFSSLAGFRNSRVLVLSVFFVLFFVYWLLPVEYKKRLLPGVAHKDNTAITELPTVHISIESDDELRAVADRLLAKTRASLSRYSSIKLRNTEDADYQISINVHISPTTENKQIGSVGFELTEMVDNSLVHADTMQMDLSDESVKATGSRIASAVASPGIGAIGRRLLQSSRLKPVEQLTAAECYANG